MNSAWEWDSNIAKGITADTAVTDLHNPTNHTAAIATSMGQKDPALKHHWRPQPILEVNLGAWDCGFQNSAVAYISPRAHPLLYHGQ